MLSGHVPKLLVGRGENFIIKCIICRSVPIIGKNRHRENKTTQSQHKDITWKLQNRTKTMTIVE